MNSTSHSGIYKIFLNDDPTYVYCLKDANNGSPWTLIMRRQDSSINFFRDWQSYKHGFGNLNGEFWLGLEKMHILTSNLNHELWIELRDFEGETRVANYTHFVIDNEENDYKISVLGIYSGNAGDSFRYHMQKAFTTKDKSVTNSKGLNCVATFYGGWWYDSCHHR